MLPSVDVSTTKFNTLHLDCIHSHSEVTGIKKIGYYRVASVLKLRHDMIDNCIHIQDLFKGWGAQGFPTPKLDFPSLEFRKCIVNSTEALEHV